jgi:hypothetical protein
LSKTITNLSGYINILKTLRNEVEPGAVFLFRGQDKIYKTPMPKCFRNEGHRESEREMLLRLISKSPNEFQNDTFAFDQLVRAQHYGIPTRLLDLTTNPLTALFFALSNSPTDRGHVLIYKIQERQCKFFNSDSVSCLANLAQLTESERVALGKAASKAAREVFPKFNPSPSKLKREFPDLYPSFIESFNETQISRRLVQFIKKEKPYFDNRIDPITLFSVFAVLPKQSNSRISAQSGAFFLFGLSRLSSDKVNERLSKEVQIAFEKKASLMEELSAIGINSSTVYPELDKIAEAISERARNQQT